MSEKTAWPAGPIENWLAIHREYPDQMNLDFSTVPAGAEAQLVALLEDYQAGPAAAHLLARLSPRRAANELTAIINRATSRGELAPNVELTARLLEAGASLPPPLFGPTVKKCARSFNPVLATAANGVLAQWGDVSAFDGLVRSTFMAKVKLAATAFCLVLFLPIAAGLSLILRESAVLEGYFGMWQSTVDAYKDSNEYAARRVRRVDTPRVVGLLAQVRRGSGRHAEIDPLLMLLLPRIRVENQFSLPNDQLRELERLATDGPLPVAAEVARALTLIGDSGSYRAVLNLADRSWPREARIAIADGMAKMRERLARQTEANALLRASAEVDEQTLLRGAGSADLPPDQLLRPGDR